MVLLTFLVPGLILDGAAEVADPEVDRCRCPMEEAAHRPYRTGVLLYLHSDEEAFRRCELLSKLLIVIRS